MKSLSVFALCALGLTAGACSSSSKHQSPWLEASPQLAEKIDRRAGKLAYTPGLEARVELIAWFARVGEPAFDTLLEMTHDPRPDVAGAALAALGASRDTRLIPYLQEIPEDESVGVRFERARALLSLGDWSGMPVMIEGLRSDKEYTRALCHKALEDATKETFGYDPRDEAKVREAAVGRWESWWATRLHDPLLSASAPINE